MIESALAKAPACPVQAEASIVSFLPGRYAIPAGDATAFAELGPKEQARILRLLDCFRQLEEGTIVNTSKRLGFELRHLPGFSASNLRTCYYAWKEGGWRALRRGFENGRDPLPKEFIEHFRGLAEQNSRSVRQAMEVLYRDWAAGVHIPGYGTFAEWYLTRYPDRDLPRVACEMPAGWRKSNLYAIAPRKAERALKTGGFAKAKQHLPSLARDTGNLLPLQLITIDDFEIDQLCFYWDPEKRTRAICRMAGVAAMDVSTRRILGLVLKPRLEDEAGRKQAITRAETRLLLYQILRDYGVPRHGMTFLVENAAAGAATEAELTFTNLFGGRVAFTRTSMIAAKVLSNGFIERGGKPWLKGWIESGFNLMHNIAAVLPGQKGAHYMVAPGDLEEKRRLAERLIGTGDRDAQLSDEQLSRARIPFKSPEELCDAYLQIFAIMENRTNHKMAGFEKIIEWRRGDGDVWQDWEALAELTEAEQMAVQLRDRMQSPRERWAALWPKVECDPIAEHVLMMLLLTPKKAKLKSFHLTFAHNGQGYTWIVDPRSPIAQLRNDSEVLIYFDPASPTHAHVCRLDGRPLGEVKRLGMVDISDAKACTDAERQLAELYGAVLATVRARPLHQLEDRRLAEDSAINEGIKAEAEAMRNERGVSATLARTMPSHEGATTGAGDHLARTVVSSDQAARNATRNAKALQQAAIDTSTLL